MNNRFKFRVWDKLAERMIYPHNDNQQHFIIDLNGRFHNLQNGSGGDDYVIQQYTGLNDKNNIETTGCKSNITDFVFINMITEF